MTGQRPGWAANGTGSTRRVGAQAGWAASLQVAGLALRYGLAIVIANVHGAYGLGLYALAIAFGSLAALLGRAGMDHAALRFTARYRARGDTAAATGVAVLSTVVTAVLATLVGTALVGAAAAIEHAWQQPGLGDALRLAALGVPAVALGEVWRDTLRARHDVRVALALEHVVIPGGTLAVIVVAAVMGRSSVLVPVVASTATAWVAAGVAAAGLARVLRREPARPSYHVREWTIFAAFLSLEGGLLYLLQWTDQLLLGAFLGAEDVGVYVAAVRLAGLVAVPLLAVNASLGPVLAALHGAGDREGLRRMYARFTWATAATGTLLAIALLVGGERLLGLFGPSFTAGSTALALLVLGQVVNAATGSSGLLLAMTGHVRWRLVNAVLAAALNVALNLVLVPAVGIVGAAVATGTSIAAINLLQVAEVRLVLGFWGYDPGELRSWWASRPRRRRAVSGA